MTHVGMRLERISEGAAGGRAREVDPLTSLVGTFVELTSALDAQPHGAVGEVVDVDHGFLLARFPRTSGVLRLPPRCLRPSDRDAWLTWCLAQEGAVRGTWEALRVERRADALVLPTQAVGLLEGLTGEGALRIEMDAAEWALPAARRALSFAMVASDVEDSRMVTLPPDPWPWAGGTFAVAPDQTMVLCAAVEREVTVAWPDWVADEEVAVRVRATWARTPEGA